MGIDELVLVRGEGFPGAALSWPTRFHHGAFTDTKEVGFLGLSWTGSFKLVIVAFVLAQVASHPNPGLAIVEKFARYAVSVAISAVLTVFAFQAVVQPCLELFLKKKARSLRLGHVQF